MKVISFVCLFFYSLIAISQTNLSIAKDSTANWSALQYKQALQSIYILKNKGNCLPFTNLEQLKIASLGLGLAEDNVFQHTLSKYSLLQAENLAVDQFYTKEMIHTYTQLEADSSILLLALSAQDLAQKDLGLFIQYVSQQSNVVLCTWGDVNALKQLSTATLEALDALLWSEKESDFVQSLMAQTLFGGVNITNTLANEISPLFPKGTGYSIEAKRLGYAPAAIVEMDSVYLHKNIDSIVQKGLDAQAYPGAQVLVAKSGKIIFHKTYGYHTYDSLRQVRVDDIYDLASVSKITSALAALMKLHGEEQFDLDAPLKAYFPKFKHSNKKDLKWRNILAHHARLYPWIPYWKTTLKKNGKFKFRTLKNKASKRYPIQLTPQLYLHKNYKKKLYKAIKKSELRKETGYKYSGLSFYLYPEIVENLVGQDYETYLKNTFYRPLGAHTITYNAHKHFELERIIPTEQDTFFRKTLLHGIVHDEGAAMMNGVSANAGLFASANDLAKLAQMYLNKGTYGGERFIAASSLEEFTRCQFCEVDNRRGLGFDKPMINYVAGKSSVAKSASANSYGHSGYTGTFLWIDPEKELIYIFFSNRVHPTRENRELYRLDIRPSIHQAIYDAILE